MRQAQARLAVLFQLLAGCILVGYTLTACSLLPGQLTLPEATATLPALATNTLVATALPTDVNGTPAATSLTLRLWVPPQFDPNNGSPAGTLLANRLEQFAAQHPGVKIEVRLKAQEGPSGLLDALAAASAAAPLALPDLIALPRPLLETAALKGLLHPYDGLSAALDDPDWYSYARQLAYLQDSTFGLPFAGEALALAYIPTALPSSAPRTWSEALAITQTLSFPAADPQALFTLALYQAAGGRIQDDESRPMLEPEILAQVLNFYQQGEASGLLPFWLTQYETEGQAWEAYQQGRAVLALTWSTRLLDPNQTSLVGTLPPTPSGQPFTLATGWAWALASPQPEHQQLSAALAEYLTAPEFLAEWSWAAGYLPTRPSALAAWPGGRQHTLATQAVQAAQAYPPSDLLSSLGPVLKQAVVQVLKRQIDPASAAQAAAEALK